MNYIWDIKTMLGEDSVVFNSWSDVKEHFGVELRDSDYFCYLAILAGIGEEESVNIIKAAFTAIESPGILQVSVTSQEKQYKEVVAFAEEQKATITYLTRKEGKKAYQVALIHFIVKE